MMFMFKQFVVQLTKFWFRPLSISTTFVQPGCGDTFGPYCYGANAYTVFTATAPAGDFITVDIIAGETEVGYDNLEFYDGVGNTGNLLYSAGMAITQVFLYYQHRVLLLCILMVMLSGIVLTE